MASIEITLSAEKAVATLKVLCEWVDRATAKVQELNIEMDALEKRVGAYVIREPQ